MADTPGPFPAIQPTTAPTALPPGIDPAVLKPGWRTTEWWFSIVAAVVGGFIASGLFPADSLWMKVAGIAAVALASLGYSVSRGVAKAGFHSAKLLVVVVLFGSATGCACSSEAHRNDAACVIIHDIVDCTEDAVIAVAPQFLPVVRALINALTGADGTIDWAQVEASLVGLGVRDGGCILALLGEEYGQKPTAGPKGMRQAQSYGEGFSAMRGKRWPNVRFKIASAAGGTVIR